MPLIYVTIYAVHLGFSADLAFYLVSVANGASFCGRVLPVSKSSTSNCLKQLI